MLRWRGESGIGDRGRGGEVRSVRGGVEQEEWATLCAMGASLDHSKTTIAYKKRLDCPPPAYTSTMAMTENQKVSPPY